MSLTLICLASSPSARAVAPSQATFQQGYDAYAAGAYEQAAVVFGELAACEPSVGVFHNLGNAEWKRGRIGDAVLAWERAQWLSPFSANTRANLRFARQKAQLPVPALAWYEICSTWLPVGTWAVLAAGSFWLALAMVLLPGILHWRKADWHQGFAAGSLAIFLLTIPALVGVHTRSELGVVLSKDTPLRLTPTHEGQILGRLPAGEIARIERARGQYFYIRAGNENAAWVDGTQFGRISVR